MEQSADKVAGVYDSISTEYAEVFSDELEKKPGDQQMLQKFARRVGGSRPVWDLGCGPGQTTRYLKNLGVDVSGLDVSGRMTQRAKENHPDIHFQRGDILALDFEDNSIAAVLAFYAMVHFNNDQVRKALRNIYRVLKPGGVFLFTFHIGGGAIHLKEFCNRPIDIDFMFFSTDFMVGVLKECGFTDLEVMERDPYPEVEYQSRRAYLFAAKPPGVKKG